MTNTPRANFKSHSITSIQKHSARITRIKNSMFIVILYRIIVLMSRGLFVGVYSKFLQGAFFVCVRLKSSEVWSCKVDVNNKVSF